MEVRISSSLLYVSEKQVRFAGIHCALYNYIKLLILNNSVQECTVFNSALRKGREIPSVVGLYAC
jgi:hypothetical protein